MNIFYILLANFSLFYIGFIGIIINRKYIISILISLEIMLLSINLNFLCLSLFLDDIMGELFAMIIFTVAAAEFSTVFAIIISIYQLQKNITISVSKPSTISL